MAELTAASLGNGTARIARPDVGAPASRGGNPVPVEGNRSPQPPVRPQSTGTVALVEELNARSRSIGRSIRFQVDPNTDASIIQVINRDTGKLIRQIPADQAAVLAANLSSLNLQRIVDVV